MNKSILEILQEGIYWRLNGDAQFEFIPVNTVRPREEGEALQIADILNKALAGLLEKNGKSGIAAIVQMPTCQAPNPNTPGPLFEIAITISVIENPLINMGAAGTKLSAESVALSVLHLLHHYRVSDELILSGDKTAIAPNYETPGVVCYEVYLRVFKTGLPIARRVNEPSLSVYAGTVQMDCHDAEIYFTCDGSFPSPANPAAKRYAGNFKPNDDCILIRAAAYREDWQGSDVVELQFKN